MNDYGLTKKENRWACLKKKLTGLIKMNWFNKNELV